MSKTKNIQEERSINRFFSYFMRDHHKIYAFLLAMVHSHNDADDIMQEVAIVLWEKFGEFDERQSFVAWGIGIAKNLVYRYRHSQKQQERLFRASVYEALERSVSHKMEHFDTKMDALRHCVKKLKAADQDLLVLRYEQKMSIKSIANKLQRSLKGLYRTYTRIHSLLENCINREVSLQEKLR